jgi:chorismate mutase
MPSDLQTYWRPGLAPGAYCCRDGFAGRTETEQTVNDVATALQETDAARETGADPVATGRARIDEIDRAIIDLIRTRMTVSENVQRARIASGGRRIALSRETEIIGRYGEQLGAPGTALAMSLLDLCRGQA